MVEFHAYKIGIVDYTG